MLYRKAILIIHGFTGNLYENEYLMNYLELYRNFDVYAKTLPGHDGIRFKNTKYNDWIEFIDDEIDNLVDHGYHEVYIVGHSMGGILACIAATHNKHVKKIVLLNAAFQYLNLEQNKIDIFENKDYSKITFAFDKIFRTSVSFFIEFTKLVNNYQDIIENVNCEVLVLQSLNDELVPPDTAIEIYNRLNSKKKFLTHLNNCSHAPFVHSNNKKELAEYIGKFLKGGLKWKQVMKKEL